MCGSRSWMSSARKASGPLSPLLTIGDVSSLVSSETQPTPKGTTATIKVESRSFRVMGARCQQDADHTSEVRLTTQRPEIARLCHLPCGHTRCPTRSLGDG